MKNVVHFCDCMDFMKDLPDNAYDLAIVDPPYGIDCGDQRRQKSRTKAALATDYHYSGWDKAAIKKETLDEIIRVSKNQIIFGANHFISQMPFNSSAWVVWDKDNTGDFADCELAWTSFLTAVRRFRFRWNGMLQGNMRNKEARIHPTQKPIALYKWLLQTYAKPGWTIVDTHVGSGSLRVACYDLGFAFDGCEIDEDYWTDQEARFKAHQAQGRLFEPKELRQPEQIGFGMEDKS